MSILDTSKIADHYHFTWKYQTPGEYRAYAEKREPVMCSHAGCGAFAHPDCQGEPACAAHALDDELEYFRSLEDGDTDEVSASNWVAYWQAVVAYETDGYEQEGWGYMLRRRSLAMARTVPVYELMEVAA